MKKKDYKFFFGWSLALFIATFIWCLVGELMNTSSFALHIISGVLCVIGGLSALIFGLMMLKKDE